MIVMNIKETHNNTDANANLYRLDSDEKQNILEGRFDPNSSFEGYGQYGAADSDSYSDSSLKEPPMHLEISNSGSNPRIKLPETWESSKKKESYKKDNINGISLSNHHVNGGGTENGAGEYEEQENSDEEAMDDIFQEIIMNKQIMNKINSKMKEIDYPSNVKNGHERMSIDEKEKRGPNIQPIIVQRINTVSSLGVASTPGSISPGRSSGSMSKRLTLTRKVRQVSFTPTMATQITDKSIKR
eukprot:UN34142